MFEYMKKNEYKESGIHCREIIRDVQEDLKDTFHFNIHLIGSCKSRLMMRNGKGPYDFDYSLEIVKDKKELESDPKEIREIVFNSFQKFAEKHSFSKMENSTRVIKLKSHSNKIQNHIEYSMEVAIIKKLLKTNNMNTIIFDKENERYIWNEEEDISNLNPRFRELRKTCWIEFKEKYKKKKNNNLDKNSQMKSISLFKETINELEQN